MTYLLPILFVIVVWWFSTGAILWLAGGERGQKTRYLAVMTGVAVLGFIGIYASGQSEGKAASYIAFLSTLAVWGWVEFLFLTGRVTGSRSASCPEKISERDRFVLAFRAIDHHEYLLLAALVATGALCALSGSFTALWLFGLLWLMRLSAKLTLFSGAPNISVEMMPTNIAHLQSYFRLDRTGPVFWVSTVLSTAALVVAIAALSNGTIAVENQLVATMLTTFLALAVLEHWFMVLPIADSTLWRWAMPGSRTEQKINPTPKPRTAISAAD